MHFTPIHATLFGSHEPHVTVELLKRCSWGCGTAFLIILHLHVSLEREMATHSSTLAWKIPWTPHISLLLIIIIYPETHKTVPKTNWVVLKYIFIVFIFKSSLIGKYSFVVFAFVNGFPPNTKAVKEPDGQSGLATILGSLTLLFHLLLTFWE